MKGWTLLLWFGRCGWGWRGGEDPDVRLGLLRLSWCRGWIGFRIAAWREALRAHARRIGG